MKVVVRMSGVLVETDVHLTKKKMWAVRGRHHLVFFYIHLHRAATTPSLATVNPPDLI